MVVYIILGIAAVVMAVVGYMFGSKSQTEIIKTLTSERDVQKAYADNYKASLETETERNRQKEAELKESFDRQLADIKEAYDKQLAELKDSHDKQLAQTKDNADKLETIPGYSCAQTIERFQEIATTVGVSLSVQTDDITPADKKLYALRDVTGTVSSIPLIVASILSKKLAEGAHTLVFDVKCGKGAFMKTREDAARATFSASIAVT